jgi:beta-glucosidase/6-phospho-beta-glucosidase/beta-galactosidase
MIKLLIFLGGKMKKFNQNFIFSTSTCAFQIEGGRELGGRKKSI